MAVMMEEDKGAASLSGSQLQGKQKRRRKQGEGPGHVPSMHGILRGNEEDVGSR